MVCRRMLGARDCAAIVAELGAGLSQVRIVRLIGRSPSVVCHEIARHTGLDGEFRAEVADRSRPAMERDMNLTACIRSYIGVCCCVTRVASQRLTD